jgi:hypothetical protein
MDREEMENHPLKLLCHLDKGRKDNIFQGEETDYVPSLY